MKNLIGIIKFVILSAAIVFIGQQFLAVYQRQVRYQGIDACAQSSFYQAQYTDAEGRTITIREPQKHIYEQCLLYKNITLGQ